MKSQPIVKTPDKFDVSQCDNQDVSPSDHDMLPSKGHVSERLRQARIQSGISIEEWSNRLNIPVRYLQAIEDVNTSELPIRVYTFGFVRTYAQNLGLNSTQILKDFKAEAMQDLSSQHLSMPQPIQGNTLPKKSILWLTFLIFLVFIFLGWFYVHSRSAPLREKTLVPQIIESELTKLSSTTSIPASSHPTINEMSDKNSISKSTSDEKQH